MTKKGYILNQWAFKVAKTSLRPISATLDRSNGRREKVGILTANDLLAEVVARSLCDFVATCLKVATTSLRPISATFERSCGRREKVGILTANDLLAEVVARSLLDLS